MELEKQYENIKVEEIKNILIINIMGQQGCTTQNEIEPDVYRLRRIGLLSPLAGVG